MWTKRLSWCHQSCLIHERNQRFLRICLLMGYQWRSSLRGVNERSKSQSSWLYFALWCHPQRRRINHPNRQKIILRLWVYFWTKTLRANLFMWSHFSLRCYGRCLQLFKSKKRSHLRRRIGLRNTIVYG